jgi:hypothetical protein
MRRSETGKAQRREVPTAASQQISLRSDDGVAQHGTRCTSIGAGKELINPVFGRWPA